MDVQVPELTKEQISNLRRWVKALRSGEYNQTRGQLKNPSQDNSMCCLGVMCDVTNPDHWGDDGEYFWHDNDCEFELPQLEILKLYGFTYELAQEFAGYNDNQHLTFNEIADKVEEYFHLESYD